MNVIGDSLSLKEIVDYAKNHTISLPTVQRGFVWKPYQIEDLWDSLLRCFPIGAFVLSDKSSPNERYELIDGQQRASAISLGFYNLLKNPDIADEIFNISNENFIIFIDLVKPGSDTDNRKYLFRVITKSHPWGYRRKENYRTLESKNIAKAMMSYKDIKNHNYLEKPLREFWPYDSYEPIPLGLFINATSLENLKGSIQEWMHGLKVKDGEKLQVIEKRNEGDILFYRIEEIYKDVQTMLNGPKVPVLKLNLSKFGTDGAVNAAQTTNAENEDAEIEDSSDDEVNEDDQGKSEARDVDEIENLFIRLNKGGTPLAGEDLNYSILKAKFGIKLQKKIEDGCKGLFQPARFITIAFRLFNVSNRDSENERDYLSMKIKPKQFQRAMSGIKGGGFKDYLEGLLKSDVFDSIRKILVYDSDSNPIGLPKFIAYSLAEDAPEIMLMLMYRLWVKKDSIISSGLRPKVLGIITLFNWLGKGDKQRDHGKLLHNIWLCVKNFDDEKRFWSNETVQRAMIKDGDFEILTPFPESGGLKYIARMEDNIAALALKKVCSTKYCNISYDNFFQTMFSNRDVILYAQRAAISKWFHDIEDYNLDDTNRAFDWDHICPANWIRRKHKIHPSLKSWYYSGGNLRAWPYSLNRCDQDIPPADKLNPKSAEDIKWWAEYLDQPNLTESELMNYLITRSFCDSSWLDLDDNIRQKIWNNPAAKQIIHSILSRNISICMEWYKQLEIDELFFTNPGKNGTKNLTKNLFGKVINQVKWHGDKEDDERYAFYLSLGENDLHMSFSFNVNIEESALGENEVRLEISENNDNGVLSKISNGGTKYVFDDGSIGSDFTLISYSEDSIINLFREFYSWLVKFPDNKIRSLLVNKFQNSIKSQYIDEIIGKAG